ncbi:MAG: PfkB family carbohydrate kinase [Candidatus Omnitrophota bacterium]
MTKFFRRTIAVIIIAGLGAGQASADALRPSAFVNGPEKTAQEQAFENLKKAFDLKGAITKALLAEAINELEDIFNSRSQSARDTIVNNIAYPFFEREKASPGKTASETPIKKDLLDKIKVFGIDVIPTGDVTFMWKETAKNGPLELTNVIYNSGGGSVNIAKVFANFNEYFGLMSFAGRGRFHKRWRQDFESEHVINFRFFTEQLHRKINIYNIVKGEKLPVLCSRGNTIPRVIVNEFLKIFEKKLKKCKNVKFLTLNASSMVAFEDADALRAYKKIIEIAHKHKNKIEVLIDFSSTTKPDVIKAVLELNEPRKRPCDIITPSLEQFIKILESTGLAKKNELSRDTLTDKKIATYAWQLIKDYNLSAVLIKRDKDGLILVRNNYEFMREKGLEVEVVSEIAAGDAAAAGLLIALSEGKSWQEAIKTADLFGAATVILPATEVVTPEALDFVKKEQILQNISQAA